MGNPIPKAVHAELCKDSGEYGRGAWNGFGFAKMNDGGFALMYTSFTAARIWEDKIEIYVDEAQGTYNKQNFCMNNTPWNLRFDIRSGGKDVKFGQTYFLMIGEHEYQTKTGVRIDANGRVGLIDPLVEAAVDKAKARQVLAMIRERLKIPFATAKLLGVDRNTKGFQNVSDGAILDAIVRNETECLAATTLTCDWRQPLDYRKSTENFIKRYKPEIYEAFGCYL